MSGTPSPEKPIKADKVFGTQLRLWANIATTLKAGRWKENFYV
jgi:hypothetical protein